MGLLGKRGQGGSGIMSWLKILEMDKPHSIKKVIGFDIFDKEFVNNLSGIDKASMSKVFIQIHHPL